MLERMLSEAVASRQQNQAVLMISASLIQLARPSTFLRPTFHFDEKENTWKCSHGEIFGSGATLEKAMESFDRLFFDVKEEKSDES